MNPYRAPVEQPWVTALKMLQVKLKKKQSGRTVYSWGEGDYEGPQRAYEAAMDDVLSALQEVIKENSVEPQSEGVSQL
jgi:hypothetical protein